MAGQSGGAEAEAEAQLLLELRTGVERLLEEQERLVARFTRRWLRPVDTDGTGHVQDRDAGHTAEAQASRFSKEASLEVFREPVQPAMSHAVSQRTTSKSSGALHERRSKGMRRADTRYTARLAQSIITGTFDIPSEDARRLSSTNPLKRCFYQLYFFCSAIEEPERTGLFARIVHSPWFELMTLTIIMLNGVLVLYQTEVAARNARGVLPVHQDQDELVFIIELVFTAYFVTEIILRLLLHRLYFFCNKDWFWNTFDLTVVLATLVDVIFSLVGGGSDRMDATLLRILRIFRMFRSLRLVRALHFVRPLRQLIECMVSSLAVVFWCLVLLIFVTAIFATFLVQSVTSYLMDSGPLLELAVEGSEEPVAEMARSFSGIISAMWVLFKATSGGEDWAYFYDLLVPTGYVAPFVFMVYIIFFFIAAWNIVSSLFMEKVMSLAQPDMDQQLLEKRREDVADAKVLKALLETVDHEQEGFLTVDEFQGAMRKPRFRHFFEMRGIDVKDAEAFFGMLEAAAGSTSIALDVLVRGLMRMRGAATNMDLQALQFQLQVDKDKAAKTLKALMEMVQGVAAELRRASVGEMSRRVLAAHEVSAKEEEVQHKVSSASGSDGRRSEAVTSVEKDIEGIAMTRGTAMNGLEAARPRLLKRDAEGHERQAMPTAAGAEEFPAVGLAIAEF